MVANALLTGNPVVVETGSPFPLCDTERPLGIAVGGLMNGPPSNVKDKIAPGLVGLVLELPPPQETRSIATKNVKGSYNGKFIFVAP